MKKNLTEIEFDRMLRKLMIYSGLVTNASHAKVMFEAVTEPRLCELVAVQLWRLNKEENEQTEMLRYQMNHLQKHGKFDIIKEKR